MQRLASTLFAYSQGAICEGRHECHWCAGPCDDRWVHDDLPPVPFTKTKSSARRPANPYICAGCWLYRRKRVTVHTLSGRMIDRQCLMNYSWFMTDDDVFVLVDPTDLKALYAHILNPPKSFALSFITSPKTDNQIQWVVYNELDKLQADTPIHFSIDNVLSCYTIYELEEGLKHGAKGKIPGVRLLIETLGPYTLPIQQTNSEAEYQRKSVGRPKKREDSTDGRTVKRSIRA